MSQRLCETLLFRPKAFSDVRDWARIRHKFSPRLRQLALGLEGFVFGSWVIARSGQDFADDGLFLNASEALFEALEFE